MTPETCLSRGGKAIYSSTKWENIDEPDRGLSGTHSDRGEAEPHRRRPLSRAFAAIGEPLSGCVGAGGRRRAHPPHDPPPKSDRRRACILSKAERSAFRNRRRQARDFEPPC